MDGRNPIDTDNDLFSNNVGPDDVITSANDTFFWEKGYKTTQGVVIVVGIKALTDNANYQLMISGSQAYRIQPFFELLDSVTQTKTFYDINSRGTNNTHMFKFYNWGGKDFKIQIDVTEGYAYVLFNFFSE